MFNRKSPGNLILYTCGFFLTELSVYLSSISSLVRSALGSDGLSTTAAVVAMTSLASLGAYFVQRMDSKKIFAQRDSNYFLICGSAFLSLPLAISQFGSTIWFILIFIKLVLANLIPAYILAAVVPIPGADEIKINKWLQSASSFAFLLAMALSPSLASFFQVKHFFILESFLVLCAGLLFYLREVREERSLQVARKMSVIEERNKINVLIEKSAGNTDEMHFNSSLQLQASAVESKSHEVSPSLGAEKLDIKFLAFTVFLVYFVFGIFNVIEIPYLTQKIKTTVSELSSILLLTGVANLFAVFLLPDTLLKRFSKEIFAVSAILLLSSTYFYLETTTLTEVFCVVILIGCLNSFVTVTKTSLIQMQVDKVKKASGFLALRLAANCGLCFSTLLFLKAKNFEELRSPIFFASLISSLLIGFIFYFDHLKIFFSKLASNRVAIWLLVVLIFGVSLDTQGEELRIPLPNNLQTLDPAKTIDTSSALILNQIYDNLYLYSDSNSLKPHLVSSHSISNDGKIFQIKLNPSVTFSDGTVLTALDVANSIERAAYELKDEAAWALGDVDGFSEFVRSPQLGKMRGIKVISNLEIQFTLQKSFRQFLQTLAAPYFAIVKPVKAGFIGTGAYVLDIQTETTTKLKLRTNSLLAPGQPTALQFIVSPRKEDYLNLLNSNKVDIAETQIAKALSSNLKVQKIDYIQNIILIFNSKRNQFKKAEARIQYAMAFKDAVKRESINLTAVGEGASFAGSSLLNLNVMARKGDPKFVAQVIFFDSAGSFTTERVEQTAKLVSKNGYKTTFERLNIKELFKRVTASNFDAAMIGFVPDYLDLDAILTPLLKTGQQYNFTKYSNPLLDQLLDLARSIDDKKSRLSVYAKATEIVLKDSPIAFLGSQGSYLYFSKNWQIPPVTGMGLHMMKFQNARYIGASHAEQK